MKTTKLKTSWNFSQLISKINQSEIESELKKVASENNKFITKWKHRKDYLTDPTLLREALDEYELLFRNFGTDGKVGYYFQLRSSQDEINPAIKAEVQKIQQFSQKLENNIRFFSLNLAHVPIETQNKLLIHPALKKYHHYLEQTFQKAKYVLSDKEEKILNLKTLPSYYQWVQMTSGLLSQEESEIYVTKIKKQKVPFAGLSGYMRSKEKKVRDSAAIALNTILDKYKQVAEAEINAILTNKKIDDELRGFERPDSSRHLSDDIESEVVDALLQSVSKHFDIPKKYYQLKAKLLGVDILRYHERNVEYGSFNKQYNFEESYKLIENVFQKLDPSFAEILNRLISQGSVDAFPYKGKRSGAFCIHYLLSQPTYVLLNHTNKLSDVLTFAHEFGHAINNEMMREKQHALSFGSPTSTAEVASTFMEDFVLQELLKNATDEEKLSLLMLKLDADISTIFRQIAFYRFEQELHKQHRKKGYLSFKEIGTLFTKHMESYMGPSVEQSAGSENWWIYVPHFRYFFYVYSYASGLLISKSMQASVKKDNRFIEKVKDFLSAGESASPKVIFKQLGVDITNQSFWEQGLTEIQQLLDETVVLAEKLKKA